MPEWEVGVEALPTPLFSSECRAALGEESESAGTVPPPAPAAAPIPTPGVSPVTSRTAARRGHDHGCIGATGSCCSSGRGTDSVGMGRKLI